ncbi:hypothetical protein IAU60_001933 [Kwoniella sp. DSM 27419]
MAGPADATPRRGGTSPPELKAVVEFLRGKNGPKVRRGILNGKRVDYFKVSDRASRSELTTSAFFLRTDRPQPATPPPPGTPKTLNLAPQQTFDPLGHYTWFYDGSPLYTILGGAAMVVVMLAGVMFPLWPIQLRIGVWYLSIGVLILIGLFIALAIVRLILWCITVVSMKRAIWIYPNLFEDFDSFRPGWAYDEPKKKKRVGKKVGARAKGEKGEKGDAAGGAETGSMAEATAQDAPPVTAEASAPAPQPSLRSRQAATIEEIDDDQS